MSCRGFVPSVVECEPAMLSRPSGREDVKGDMSSSTTAAKNKDRTPQCQCRNNPYWFKLNSEIDSTRLLFPRLLCTRDNELLHSFKGTDPVFYKSKHNKDSRPNDCADCNAKYITLD